MHILRNVTVLTWFNFFVDFKLYAPIAILYFAQVSGSFALGMSIFSIAMLSAAVFEVPTGVFSDLIGRKRTVICGALACVIAVTFYAIGGSYIYLVIGALFEGLSVSFYSGNNEALLHDSLREAGKEEEFHAYLGRTSSMFQIALGTSGVLGGVIAYLYSFNAVLWLSVAAQVITLLLSFYFIEPQKINKETTNIYAHLKDSIKNFIGNKEIRLLSISSMLSYGIGEAVWDFQAAFYSSLWPVWAIGIVKAISNAGAALSYYFSGKIINKVGPFRLLFTVSLYNRIVNSIAVIFPTVFSPLLMASTSVFYGAVSVAKSSLFQKQYTQRERATMGSLNSFGGSIVFAVIAFFMGFTADQLSPAQAILLMQIVSLIIVFIYWKLFSKNK